MRDGSEPDHQLTQRQSKADYLVPTQVAYLIYGAQFGPSIQSVTGAAKMVFRRCSRNCGGEILKVHHVSTRGGFVAVKSKGLTRRGTG